MHFDCRVDGIGRTIAKTSGKPFVPEAGHPCLPAVGGQPAARELELPARAKPGPRPSRPPSVPPPPGHWINPSSPSGALPSYKDEDGKARKTDYAINVSNAAWKQPAIDLLLFFHGDPGPCASVFNRDPDRKFNDKKFELDAQIDNSKRKMVLVAPRIFWIPGNKNDDANIKGIWTASNLNAFIEEVLDKINLESGVKPKIERLIIAGHSHAYAIFTALACEFEQDAEATGKGALAKLKEVWALDTTYSGRHVHGLEIWARKLPACRFTVVLKDATDSSPMINWKEYFGENNYCPSGCKLPTNMTMLPVPEKHCVLPTKYIGQLLSAKSP